MTPVRRRETRQERLARIIAQCEAEKPPVAFKIRGLSLTARGTDVDEIYGNINVSSMTLGNLKVTSRYHSTGWHPTMLWSSKGENRNLGKYPETFFPEVTVPVDPRYLGKTANLIIGFDVRDEDGARGGGDDEYFYVATTAQGKPTAVYSLDWHYPSCRESPEFNRTGRLTLNGKAPGSASGNVVTFQFQVEMSRSVGP